VSENDLKRLMDLCPSADHAFERSDNAGSQQAKINMHDEKHGNNKSNDYMEQIG
jgi:hypothetical protein